MVKAPVVRSLPDVLTVDEIARIVGATRERRYQTFWWTTYSMGLRLGEALNLRVGDIDSARGQVHVRAGKGRKDRFVVLPSLTLKCLRRYWRSTAAKPVQRLRARPRRRLTRPLKCTNIWYTRRCAMARNTSVSLGDHFEQFIAGQVDSGRYGSASEVVRAGLRLLETSESKLEVLRKALIAGERSGRSKYSYEALMSELNAEPECGHST